LFIEGYYAKLMSPNVRTAKGASNERAQECPIDAVRSRTSCEAGIGTGFNARSGGSGCGRFRQNDLQVVVALQK
jgi:hypothetical protein